MIIEKKRVIFRRWNYAVCAEGLQDSIILPTDAVKNHCLVSTSESFCLWKCNEHEVALDTWCWNARMCLKLGYFMCAKLIGISSWFTLYTCIFLWRVGDTNGHELTRRRWQFCTELWSIVTLPFHSTHFRKGDTITVRFLCSLKIERTWVEDLMDNLMTASASASWLR